MKYLIRENEKMLVLLTQNWRSELLFGQGFGDGALFFTVDRTNVKVIVRHCTVSAARASC